ncbi:hypothetical protein QI745_004366 [Salmonella enterica]|nr:hypothetical protein [Klebsiella pneumoniae]ELD7174571.1 hypothetical protein [Salmonella enterica]EMB9114647.1 hypothetical protein [Klebsiella quasipneumoniae]HCI5948662.1 hypothetical protein [Klebsiella quasipneumoniae subsp. quasipneumoniae]ELD7222479.1 hypothetical protein [Salmonella enterica]
MQALNDESLVVLSAEFATRGQINCYSREHGSKPLVLMEANSPGVGIEIVRRTSLSTLLPLRTAFAHDDLIAITLEAERLQRTAVLIRRKNACQSSAARIFTELSVVVSR